MQSLNKKEDDDEKQTFYISTFTFMFYIFYISTILILQFYNSTFLHTTFITTQTKKPTSNTSTSQIHSSHRE